MLTLIEKEHLIDNIWAFRFKPDKSVSWVPGQYIQVELEHENPDDEGVKRWFTVSSAPFDGFLQITTRVTQSTFKQALSRLLIGGTLPMIEEPHGDFVWLDTDRPLVFVAGGIGITPFRSILRQRAHDGQPLNVTLIYGNRTDAIVFKDELDDYAAKDPGLEVQYVIGEPLDAKKLISTVPHFLDSLVYISGPEPMIEALGADLRKAGLPESQLKEDFFPNYTEENY